MNQTVKQNKSLLLKLMVLLSLVLCALFSWSTISRAAEKTFQTEEKYSAKAIEESDTSCKIVFTQNEAMSNVIIHYVINNNSTAQLNETMENTGNEWSHTIQNIAKGDSINIQFTYSPASGAIDSPWVTYVMGSASEGNNSDNNESTTTEETATEETTTEETSTEETTSNIRIEAETYSKMSGVNKEVSQISSFETNNWVRYQTNITDTGKYRIVVRGKSDNTNGMVVFRDASKRIATVSIHTGDIAEYSSDTIDLTAGSLELTAVAVAGNITADWIELQPVKEDNPGNQDGNTEPPTDNPDNSDDSNPSENPIQTDIPVAMENLPTKEGKMIFQFNNLTNGKYSDDQIYWCILGRDPATNNFCYVEADGTMKPLSTALNTISVGDRKCADICNTIAESKYVYMPSIVSGRMYISYGEQVYITVNEAADGTIGFAGPDMNNTADPNRNVYFEFLEFTIGTANEPTHYWGNTTRVDNFCFPVVTRLIGENYAYDEKNGNKSIIPYDRTVGDVGSREDIFNEFRNSVPDEFKTLTDEYRIYAPCKKTFNEGQEYGNYFQSTIDAFWDKYSKETLKFTCEAGEFEAKVSDDNKIHFTDLRSGLTGEVEKPTTQDVLEGRGAFDRYTGIGDRDKTLAFEAQLCAAFNRGLALNPELWYTIDKYYPEGSKCNYYSKFWHEHGFNGYAYGFCYDDVNDQSTLLECNNAKQLVIDLKW